MAAPPQACWTTDGVAVSVQRGLLHASTGIVHVAIMNSGSECALVLELRQPAIHHCLGSVNPPRPTPCNRVPQQLTLGELGVWRPVSDGVW
jgi:hypothetical protein